MSLVSSGSAARSAFYHFRIALVAAAVVTQGCDDATGIVGDNATVRVAHAAPDGPPVEVLLRGQSTTGAGGVGFGSVTDCLSVNADDPRLTFRQTSNGPAVTAPESFGFTPSGRHLVVLWGPPANLRFTTLTDDLNPPPLEPGRARVRVFNATSVPGRIYVYLTAPRDAQSQQFLVDSVVPGGYTRYVNVAAGGVEFQLNQGDAGNVLDAITVGPLSQRELTVIAVDPAVGGSGLRWVLADMCAGR